ncbi:hypothetical protein LBMAG52_43340 [Planctomycetia bacterium]|nr:hypothetical protein LBMAG52_43340 [Planctomycetia bacterium]
MSAFRRVLIVLLIANLASGALSAPAWRHSHAISEHSAAHGHAASHSHGHRHGHSHHHDTGSAQRMGEPAVEHLHVMWFGIPLTLPAAPDDSSDRPSTLGEWVPLLSEMLPPQIVVASDVLGLDLFDATVLAVAIETPPRAEPFVPPKVSLLSDTARRERSGVLNI